MNITDVKQSYYYFNKDLSKCDISQEAISAVDAELAKEKNLLPISIKNNSLLVVTCDIENFSDLPILVDMIKAKSSANLKEVTIKYVEANNYRIAFEKCYKTKYSSNRNNDDSGTPSSEQVMLVEKIFKAAINMNASDIHITATAGDSLLQFRVNGKMTNINDITIKKSDRNAIINVIKTQCVPSLDIVNKNTPQDGSMRKYNLDFRISTVPAILGEKVVIRIFDSRGLLKGLDEIGFNTEDVQTLKRLCDSPSGMVIMTGPTGEGKTTTLYACLRYIDPLKRVIFSLENPVEQKIEGACQVQINEVENNIKANMDWHVGMRAALRQDPDVILIGEIRDEITARSAIQASQSGHLIFSTLHTNGAIESVERMINFNVPRRAFLSQVLCIIAQRLIERLCPHCKESLVLLPDKYLLRNRDIELLKGKRIYKRGAGCDKCNQTGIIGRLPIFEIIIFDNTIRDFFAHERGLVESEKFLRYQTKKFRSLWDKGLDQVLLGNVSLDDLLSCVPVDDDLS